MRVIDLFCGIGGFSLAAHSLGMDTALFCDSKQHSPYVWQVIPRHFPDAVLHDDVTTLTREVVEDALADSASVRRDGDSAHVGRSERTTTTEGRPKRSDEVEHGQSTGGRAPVILTAGFPCQDLSYAGAGAGLDGGTRSGLYREVIRLVRDLRPDWVLLENVNAIITRGVGTVLGDLASCGYGWAYCCVPACAVGAPHRRDRWWCVAWPTLGDDADRDRGERIVTSVLRGLTPFGDLAEGWPTATASDAWAGEHNRSQVIPCNGRVLTGKAGLGLGQAARGDTWPTPTGGSEKKQSCPGLDGGSRSRQTLDDAIGEEARKELTGSLNPDWVECLMGYPIGYTLPDGDPQHELPNVWPAGLGSPQHEWEPPRLTTVKTNRANRLKALGNSIVPQVARLFLAAIKEEATHVDTR